MDDDDDDDKGELWLQQDGTIEYAAHEPIVCFRPTLSRHIVSHLGDT